MTRKERQQRSDAIDGFFDVVVLPLVFIGAGVQVMRWIDRRSQPPRRPRREPTREAR